LADDAVHKQRRDTQNAPTMAAGESVSLLPVGPSDREPGAAEENGARTRFTNVIEERRLSEESARESRLATFAQAIVAVIIAALVGGVIWRIATPSSADELYEVIARAQAAAIRGPDGSEALRRAEGEIQDFLKRFPDDVRSPEIRELLERLELDKLERRLDLRARLGAPSDDPIPIERLYLEALGQATTNPGRAVAILESIVKLFQDIDTGAAQSASKGDARDGYLKLAREKLQAIQEELKNQAESELPMLSERLQTADALATTHPRQACEIYQAIVDLYQHVPWANEIVQGARERLEELK
jgi:hypothetical protein